MQALCTIIIKGINNLKKKKQKILSLIKINNNY